MSGRRPPRQILTPGRMVALICTGHGQHDQLVMDNLIDRRGGWGGRYNIAMPPGMADPAISWVPRDDVVYRGRGKRWSPVGRVDVVIRDDHGGVTYIITCPQCPDWPKKVTNNRLPERLNEHYRTHGASSWVTIDASYWP